ncbi:MAG: nuclease [Verrucomicrobia bacterium]|nr:nuclease [Verrucomicrobiota bacterium]
MRGEESSVRQPIFVVADTRENDGPVVQILRTMPGVEVCCQHLRIGDYQINDRVFERKTLLDFSESIIDGRLFSQAHRLASAEQLVAIILEGKTADLNQSQMRREALQGALISLSLLFQIPILRSFDPAESARLLIYAAQQLNRHANDQLIRRGRRPKRRRRMQLYLLQGLRGIGSEKAERLLDQFGSVEAALSASAEELQQVKGIGCKLAHSIRWILEPDSPNPFCEAKQ